MSAWSWRHRQPRDVGAIVEEQVRRWELRSYRARASSVAGWPVVTISRQFGTLGLELGQRVATRLGFSYWDREIVTEIARRLHAPEESVSVFDEHHRSALDDLFGVTFDQDAVSADYGDQLRAIVRSITRKGSAVIVGRGSQYLVEPERALRVRLVAPHGLRVSEIASRAGISLEDAAHRIRAGDRDRAQFMRQYFGKDGTDPTDYDVVVNTANYPTERADALLLMSYLTKFGHLPAAARDVERELQGDPKADLDSASHEEAPATD